MNGTGRRIGVLGAGSFGTALAVHLAGPGGHRVKLWARSAELAARMAAERANAGYLPGVELPQRLEPTSEMAALRTLGRNAAQLKRTQTARAAVGPC